MNANCLSCFETVPYQNGQRPNFCPKCGKSMSAGSIIQQKSVVTRKTDDENGLSTEDVRNLNFEIALEGKSNNNKITIGQLAEGSTQVGTFVPFRPDYEGNALEDVNKELEKRARTTENET